VNKNKVDKENKKNYCVCDGASEENLKTVVIAQKGREKPYMYYKKSGERGCMDEKNAFYFGEC